MNRRRFISAVLGAVASVKFLGAETLLDLAKPAQKYSLQIGIGTTYFHPPSKPTAYGIPIPCEIREPRAFPYRVDGPGVPWVDRIPPEEIDKLAAHTVKLMKESETKCGQLNPTTRS